MSASTAQQLLDKDGFLIYTSLHDYLPGSVVESRNASCVPVGTKLVIVGILSRKEAEMIADKNGMLMDSPSSARFYKVIAE